MWTKKILWSDCAEEQADLSLRWLHISEGTLSHVEAQISSMMALPERNYFYAHTGKS